VSGGDVARAGATPDVTAGSLTAGSVTRDPGARSAFAIGGVVPQAVAVPATRAALAACVCEAAANGAALVPLGLGAHRGLGHAPARYDLALSTRALTAVVDYAPADMTVTIESGVTLAALDDLLARHGQWLPLDPPLPAATTVGGLIGADLAGPLRGSQGRTRDFVIGIAMVTAEGRAAHAGGKVVKNVAGYDLMKLLIGSLGTLAIVTEATFKVRPRPEVLHVLDLAGADRAAALALAAPLATLGEVALAITLIDVAEANPTWRCILGGVAADVTTTRARILEVAHDGDAVVVYDDDGARPESRARAAAARDLPHHAAGDVVMRATALRTRAPSLVAEMLECVAGAPSSTRFDPRTGGVTLAVETAEPGAVLARVRTVAARHEAMFVVERWPDALAAEVEVWSPLPSSLPLMRRIKAALDPAGTLAPGRFVARL
jgi:glycolate oxidase FAD binding subunit